MPVNFSKVQSLFLIILGKYLHPLLVNFIKAIVCFGPSRAKAQKILNCFSGTATSVLKVPHYFFLLLSKKEKEKKRFSNFLTSLSVATMWFHSDVVVHCR